MEKQIMMKEARRFSVCTVAIVLLLGTVVSAVAYPFSFDNPGVVGALNYLRDAQKIDGSIGNFVTSSWAVMAIAAVGEDPHTWRNGGPSIVEYLKANQNLLNISKATDVARYMLSMTAAGEDPRNITGTDYVAVLEGLHVNGQIGHQSLLNDDFWSVLALASAEKANSTIIQDSMVFIKNNQNSDGGWNWAVGGSSDVDDTSAAILALIAGGEPPSSHVIEDGLVYLKQNQMENGGFQFFGGTNSASDSWAIDAIVAAGQNPTDPYWTKNGNNPVTHLLTLQNPDGSFNWTSNDSYGIDKKRMTSYAIPALVGKPYPIPRVHITIRVPHDYATIQEAINAAESGDTIFVYNGTYYEEVVVNKTVSILGENSSSTIVHGTIYIQFSHVRVSRFSITDGQGIWVEDARHCEVAHVISKNSSNFGIFLSNTNNSKITSNSLYSNYYDGICLDHTSQNNTVSLNDIQGFNRDGIGTHTSQYNLIEANTLENGNTGLHIRYAFHNILKENTIVNCTIGVWSEHSHNNTLYHNNFINNTTESSALDSEDNDWDNCCEGNYWSNYNGTDVDGDGVGDEYLPWEEVDYYPLMNRYWHPCDINHDLIIDMRDIGRAARAFGTESGDPDWNCHADITGPVSLEPDGIVDMRDVGLAARYFGETYL
ncbi:MAG: NosD domain-containing protein [Candidatus Bathyarchaeota archaeon]|jgi:parallel beta-helix repeat protein